MKCGRCEYENPDNAKYCLNCGHSLLFDIKQSAADGFKAFDDKKLKKIKIISGETTDPANALFGKILAVCSVIFMIIMSVILIVFVFHGSSRGSGYTPSIYYINSSEDEASDNDGNKAADYDGYSKYYIVSDDDFIYPYPFPDKADDK